MCHDKHLMGKINQIFCPSFSEHKNICRSNKNCQPELAILGMKLILTSCQIQACFLFFFVSDKRLKSIPKSILLYIRKKSLPRKWFLQRKAWRDGSMRCFYNIQYSLGIRFRIKFLFRWKFCQKRLDFM
jgi:hypothetical protein